MSGYSIPRHDSPFYYADFSNKSTSGSLSYPATSSSYAYKSSHTHQPSTLRNERFPDEEDYPEREYPSRKNTVKPRPPPFTQTASTSTNATLTPPASPHSSAELKQQLNIVYAALRRVEAERESLQRQMAEGRMDRSVMEKELADARRENQRLLKWLEGLTGMSTAGSSQKSPREEGWGFSMYPEGF